MVAILDTSAAILVRDGDEAALNRISAMPIAPLISILTRIELEGGVYRDPSMTSVLRPRLDLFLAQIEQLPFEDKEAVQYGKIVAAHGFSRPKIIDRMIAAQAITAGATLATLNPRDFQGIEGLRLDDWSVG